MGEGYGNPSSLHRMGHESEKRLEGARKTLASFLGVRADEVYFTSGGTQGNNLAIRGIMEKSTTGNLLVSAVEHASVYEVAKFYEAKGRGEFVRVDGSGMLNEEVLLDKVDEQTKILSLLHVNNELGTIAPIEKIARAVKEKNPNVHVHVDGVQAFGKISLDLGRSAVDSYAISGHKIHAPKGVGALYVRKGCRLEPLLYGGGQEKGLNPGTENLPGIEGLGRAVELLEVADSGARVTGLRDALVERIKGIEGHRINTPLANASPYILNVGFSGVKSEIVLHSLEDKGIFIATGSACSGSKKSRVLKAIDVPSAYVDGCIRLSLSEFTSAEEIDKFVEGLRGSLVTIRKIIGNKKVAR